MTSVFANHPMRGLISRKGFVDGLLGTDIAMTSLWLADRVDRPLPPNPLDEADRSADVVVVGAGITGLITAVLLARASRDVMVLEALTAGAGTTGNTTAKISLLQGIKLSKIVGRHGVKTAQQYVQGNLEGQEWLVQHCEAQGLSVQREDAYTYAQSEKGLPSTRDELTAGKAAGLAVEWVDDADVPFPFHGGVRLAQQAQFDPMPFLDSLIVEFDERGGRLAQGVRVQKVSGEGDGLALHVRTSAGDEFDVHAKQCVLATGIPDTGPRRILRPAEAEPVLLHGLQGAREHHARHVHLGRLAHPVGALRADRRGRSAHRRGRGSPRGPREAARRRRSRNWTHGRRCTTPAQCRPTTGRRRTTRRPTNCPMSDRSFPGNDKIFVATGFDKWGMTNGTAAALALVEPHPGRPDGLGRGVRKLEPTRAVRHSQSHADQPRSRIQSGQGLDHAGDPDRRPHARRRWRRQRPAVAVWRPAAWSTASSTGCHRCARTSAAS